LRRRCAAALTRLQLVRVSAANVAYQMAIIRDTGYCAQRIEYSLSLDRWRFAETDLKDAEGRLCASAISTLPLFERLTPL
jgi:hypothetical protein